MIDEITLRTVIRDELAPVRDGIEETVARAVVSVLDSVGVDTRNKPETQADMVHLRRWRKAVERVEQMSWVAAITVVITGVAGAFWAGVKALAK